MTTTPDHARLPKNFLASWLLLLLRNWQAHGYELTHRLTEMGIGMVDPATVYRTLRQLEEEGLLTSAWNAGAAGPARRVYTISEAGEQYLSLWATQLEQYQATLGRFFDIYNGMLNAMTPPASPDSPEPPPPNAKDL